jgi:hypothetical protein
MEYIAATAAHERCVTPAPHVPAPKSIAKFHHLKRLHAGLWHGTATAVKKMHWKWQNNSLRRNDSVDAIPHPR